MKVCCLGVFIDSLDSPIHAYVPAVLGLQKKKSETKYSGLCWEEACFNFGSMTKAEHGPKEKRNSKPVLDQEPQKGRIYELILRCELILRKYTHTHNFSYL